MASKRDRRWGRGGGQVLAMLKGEHNKFWGRFYAVYRTAEGAAQKVSNL